MKTIEDLICKRLSESAAISELLAVYDGKPAVFIHRIPDDSDENWQGEPYPRILIDLSMNEGTERQFEEGVKIHIICAKNNTVNPEDLKDSICKSMDYCFFTKSESSICTKWNRTEFSESQETKTCTHIFDLMVFYKPIIQNPDPLSTLNEWLKNSYPNAKVIGVDSMDEIWQADIDTPAIYGRLENIVPGKNGDTWEVTWMNAGIRLHILADKTLKPLLIRDISEKLLVKKKLTMSDGGPMFILKVNYNDTMNPLKNRQFFVECQYGVLKEKEDSQPIRTIDIQEGKK